MTKIATPIVLNSRKPGARGAGTLIGTFKTEADVAAAKAYLAEKGGIEEGAEFHERPYEPTTPMTFEQWKTEEESTSARDAAKDQLAKTDPALYAILFPKSDVAKAAKAAAAAK